MNFKALVPGSGGAASVAADAMLVVVHGDAVPASLGKVLGQALQQSIDAGDYSCKPGKMAWTAGAAGVKARRLVFVHAADASATAFRRAVAAGLVLLKSGGTRHLAVASSGAIDAASAEALVAAVSDAAYLYRATKPSAGEPPRLDRVSVLCAKGQDVVVG